MKKILPACFIVSLFAVSACGPSQMQVENDAALNRAIESGKPFLIYHAGFSTNSVGGVSPALDFTNLSSKTVKYAFFDITPYNAVGDAQRSEVGGVSTRRLRAVGPLNSMQGDSYTWDNAWYNGTITCITVNSVSVEYMDGSKKTISGASAVREVMVPIPDGWLISGRYNEGVGNSCRF